MKLKGLSSTKIKNLCTSIKYLFHFNFAFVCYKGSWKSLDSRCWGRKRGRFLYENQWNSTIHWWKIGLLSQNIVYYLILLTMCYKIIKYINFFFIAKWRIWKNCWNFTKLGQRNTYWWIIYRIIYDWGFCRWNCFQKGIYVHNINK